MNDLLRSVEDIAVKAGDAIMEIYRSGDFGVDHKSDDSPLTKADLAAHQVIVAGLLALTPETPVLSEESAEISYEERKAWNKYWLVDPLDGTKEFIKQNGEFTVNIALIENGVPIAGTVYAPVRGEMFSGFNEQATEALVNGGNCGNKVKISVQGRDEAKIAVASRSHLTPETEQFLTDHGVSECVSVGSSLKFCLLARGEADIYPRFGRTMEWDTAAGDAVLRAAGGRTLNPDGSPFIYGKLTQTHDAPFANPSFVAFATRQA